jgi:hypothetical protein
MTIRDIATTSLDSSRSVYSRGTRSLAVRVGPIVDAIVALLPPGLLLAAFFLLILPALSVPIADGLYFFDWTLDVPDQDVTGYRWGPCEIIIKSL